MEDSPTNPRIPQESEAIRAKVYERQSPLGRIVKWSLIVTAVVAVLVGGGLFFVSPLTTAVDKDARIQLADVLQPPEMTLKRVSVQSELGFRLSYDNRIFSSYAEVGDKSAGSDESSAILSGETYENNDLRVLRAYNYVRIRPIESVESSRALTTLPPELQVFATVTNGDLEAAQKIPENKDMSELGLFVKIDGDKRAAEKITDDNTVVTIEATKPSTTTVGGVEYQKVRYTTTNDNHRISNVKYDDCYYTIQYDQPYSICISNVRPTNVSAAALVEDVFDSVTFEQPLNSGTTSSSTEDVSDNKTSYAYPLARLAQATVTQDDPDSPVSNTSNTTSSTDDDGDTAGAGSSASNSSNSSAAEDADDTGGGESALITVTPQYYSDPDTLATVAKSMPSVVRIGTLYCADLALKFESGETATTLSDACVGNVASGVFISRDGYIATTGHAIRTQKKAAISGYINFATNREQMLDRLQRVLDYLLKAKIILDTDAEYLKTGAQIGNQEALAKVQNIGSIIPDDFITPVKEEYTYAVQPTDRPIVVNRSDVTKPSFAYSDSVLSAKYIASDYDVAKSIQYVFGSETPANDVGLLKVEGSFPDVSIATDEKAQGNDVLSTIGYAAYTDSNLSIDRIRNIPIVTVSRIDQAYDKDGRRLIQTDTPVLPGNDGAPVFNTNGQLMGFAVYGLSYCPDQSCFANGTIRSSGELLQLLDKNNIRLQKGDKTAAEWSEGIDQFFRANYTTSTSKFAVAGAEYRFNRWAEPLRTLSSSLQGSSKDTSFMNQLQSVMIVVLAILVIMTALLGVAFVLHRRRISMLQVGHYGATAAQPAQPVQSTGVQQPPQTAPLQQQVPPSQPVQPQQPVSGSGQPTVTPPAQPHPSAGEAPQTGESLSGPVPPSEDPFYK